MIFAAPPSETDSRLPSAAESAIVKLGDVKPDADYWKACDGNAKKALQDLVTLTDLAIADYPDDELLWDGD